MARAKRAGGANKRSSPLLGPSASPGEEFVPTPSAGSASRTPIGDAWRQVRGWLGCDPVWIPQPTEHHEEVVGRLLALPGVHGNLVPDAHLAALAIEHGLTLCSADGDFARFPGLNWHNPIA